MAWFIFEGHAFLYIVGNLKNMVGACDRIRFYKEGMMIAWHAVGRDEVDNVRHLEVKVVDFALE